MSKSQQWNPQRHQNHEHSSPLLAHGSAALRLVAPPHQEGIMPLFLFRSAMERLLWFPTRLLLLSFFRRSRSVSVVCPWPFGRPATLFGCSGLNLWERESYQVWDWGLMISNKRKSKKTNVRSTCSFCSEHEQTQSTALTLFFAAWQLFWLQPAPSAQLGPAQTGPCSYYSGTKKTDSHLNTRLENYFKYILTWNIIGI